MQIEHTRAALYAIPVHICSSEAKLLAEWLARQEPRKIEAPEWERAIGVQRYLSQVAWRQLLHPRLAAIESTGRALVAYMPPDSPWRAVLCPPVVVESVPQVEATPKGGKRGR